MDVVGDEDVVAESHMASGKISVVQPVRGFFSFGDGLDHRRCRLPCPMMVGSTCWAPGHCVYCQWKPCR